MQIGIVGLPFAGKSTLFQTITRTHLDPSEAGKMETHRAIIRVPDARLSTLADIFRPQKTTYATIEFVDVVGLQKGDSGSAQFTTNFLASVKTNDALVQVVCSFHEHSMTEADAPVDPVSDIVAFETEFILSDLAIVESRIEKIRKQLQKSPNETLSQELPVLERCHSILDKQEPLREEMFSAMEWRVLRSYQLLTIKPMLIAVNFDEAARDEASAILESLKGCKAGRNTKIMGFFGKIEQEISQLPDEEAQQFMSEYGIVESALTSLIRAAYDLLGLQSFFTVGEDECRAWTIKKGMTAQEAAGVIHSSFAQKFIRAEVVSYDDFVEYGGSFSKVKERGHWRLEGKDYVVQEGDILSIRHS